jgi:dienelactone hydrolase
VGDAAYDPFGPGQLAVGVRTIEIPDPARSRVYPCEIWYPAESRPPDLATGLDPGRNAAPLPGRHPLIVYSHHSGGHRRKASFLCRHLASHGYVVAAPDHTEVVAADRAPSLGATGAEREAWAELVVTSRVPDVRLVLGHLLAASPTGTALDGERVGLAGHSMGGWTVLAVPDTEPRVRAVVAMGPGGSSRPVPGVLPLELDFGWPRPVPVLYLAAENDVPIPLAGVAELFVRTPAPKRMFVLRLADHQHFVDDVEAEHEALRGMRLPGEAAWIPAAMRPVSELCTAGQAHEFIHGLALAHFDAVLRERVAAGAFLAAGAEAALAARGIPAFAYPGRAGAPAADRARCAAARVLSPAT